jgi:auxin responsive GH3 family protein
MCANTIDGGFNEIYQEWRAAGRIGPLELRIVKRGAFNEVVTSAVSKGASAVQYKILRCIKSPSVTLEILNAAVVATFKSQLKFSDHAPRGSSLALRS